MIKKYINLAYLFLTNHVVVRYLIAGGTSGVTLLVLLYLFNTVFGIHYLISAVLAFIGAFCVSFTLHKFWTFKSHGESAHRQVVLYLGTSLSGLLFNTFLMYTFVDFLGVQVITSQIIVGFLVASVTFFISRNFVFKYQKN